MKIGAGSQAGTPVPPGPGPPAPALPANVGHNEGIDGARTTGGAEREQDRRESDGPSLTLFDDCRCTA